MFEKQDRVREIIPEEIMLARLEQSEQMREFFIEMWKQNPSLAEQGGEKVKNLMKPLKYVDTGIGFPSSPTAPITSKQRGVSMIELIMFIVIIGAAMVGILSVMNVTTTHSADPLIHKQAIAIAESLLEEVELQDFIDQNNGVTTTCPAASAVTPDRSTSYYIVDCYGINGGFSTTTGFSNNALGLSGTYTAKVSIDKTLSPLGAITAGNAVRVTVTVTDPQNNQIAIDGYRTKY
jgi:MSHA pilin protein MshD